MAKVYIFTTGNRSNLEISGIYSTREMAERYRRFTFNSNDVEEYEVDKVVIPFEQGKMPYRIMMTKKGDVVRKEIDCVQLDIPTCRDCLEFTSDAMTFSPIYANNEIEAIKIVDEYRRRLIKDNKWDEVAHSGYSFNLLKWKRWEFEDEVKI